jgi:hypothetical protein
VSEVAGSTIAWASPRRLCPSSNGRALPPDRADRNRDSTGLPRWTGLPRMNTNALSVPPANSSSTMARGGAWAVRFNASIASSVPRTLSSTPRLIIVCSKPTSKVSAVGEPESWR